MGNKFANDLLGGCCQVRAKLQLAPHELHPILQTS
jgi:hypothetical protein